MKLTLEMIMNCKTEKGGFTAETVKYFGLKFGMSEMKKGWTRRLVGAEITEENYRLAKDGRSKPREKKISQLLMSI